MYLRRSSQHAGNLSGPSPKNNRQITLDASPRGRARTNLGGRNGEGSLLRGTTTDFTASLGSRHSLRSPMDLLLHTSKARGTTTTFNQRMLGNKLNQW